MALNDRQFKAMHQSLRENGGFSANAQTGKAPQVGYMVSVPGHEQQIRSVNVAPAHIKEFAIKHADQLRDSDRYIGGWDNKGETSLDVSQNIVPEKKVADEYGTAAALADARTSALDLTLSRNQEAAYDLQTGDDLVNDHFDPSRRDARL